MQKQIILNPKDASGNHNSVVWTPKFPIPMNVRKFGYCPDYDTWNPGDLILVSSLKPNLIAKSIRKVQELGGYHVCDAKWEHVAVYIGAGAICEANRKGVVVDTIFKYSCNHLIRVRRNTNLTKDQGWELAVNALKKQNCSYGMLSIVNLFFKACMGFHHSGSAISFPKSTIICSELYADSHLKVCGQVLGNIYNGEISPASLSNDGKLTDLQINWNKIAIHDN